MTQTAFRSVSILFQACIKAPGGFALVRSTPQKVGLGTKEKIRRNFENYFTLRILTKLGYRNLEMTN